MNERQEMYIQNLQEKWASYAQGVNMFVYGDVGTGKTSLAATCPKPILIHSFDPGGSRASKLQPLIDNGECIVDTSFEMSAESDWKKPQLFNKWLSVMDTLRDIGLFDNVGTFVIDTATAMADACMNECLKSNGRTGGRPEWGTYFEMIPRMTQALGAVCSLPCTVLVTGHMYKSVDDHKGVTERMFLAPGQSSIKVPALFDEKYVAMTEENKQTEEIEYFLLTEPYETYHACTRIGGEAFDLMEEADICKMFDKAGVKWEHKPAFSEGS